VVSFLEEDIRLVASDPAVFLETRGGIGAQMAVRASVGLEDEVAIATSCQTLSRRLLDAWK
jgi:hypothetical protein